MQSTNSDCRYLLNQISLAVQGQQSILEKVTSEVESVVLYTPKPGVTFHFFSSQAPCKYLSIP